MFEILWIVALIIGAIIVFPLLAGAFVFLGILVCMYYEWVFTLIGLDELDD